MDIVRNVVTAQKTHRLDMLGRLVDLVLILRAQEAIDDLLVHGVD